MKANVLQDFHTCISIPFMHTRRGEYLVIQAADSLREEGRVEMILEDF